MAAHMRLETLRHRPTTKAVVDMQVKLSRTIERLHERLHGDAADSAADQLIEFSRHLELVTRDTGIKSTRELVGTTEMTSNANVG